MIKRHVIYCDHCLDSVVEAGSNARERKPATVSHEFYLFASGGKISAPATTRSLFTFPINSTLNFPSLTGTHDATRKANLPWAVHLEVWDEYWKNCKETYYENILVFKEQHTACSALNREPLRRRVKKHNYFENILCFFFFKWTDNHFSLQKK